MNNLQTHISLLESTPWLDVEASTHCNVTCSICPRNKLTRKKGYLEPSTFSRLLDWLPPGGCSLMFSGMGEPMLNPGLPDYIKILNNRPGVTTGVTTNGTLLTTPQGKAVLESGPHWFQVSLHGTTAAEAEAIMTGSDFHQILDGLKLASRLLPSHTTRRLCAVVTDNSSTEGLHALADELGWSLFIRSRHSRAGSLYQGLKSYFDGCGIFAKVHFITSQGTLPACCQDLEGSTLLGTIWSHSFQELIQMKRRIITKKQWPALCAQCDDDHRWSLLKQG